MRIERIGLSLDSIAEERRRQHRERPDDESRFHDSPEDGPSQHTGSTADRAAARLMAEDDGANRREDEHRDDPTARLRVDLPEEHPRPARQHAIEAFTQYDPKPGHTLADTDL